MAKQNSRKGKSTTVKGSRVSKSSNAQGSIQNWWQVQEELEQVEDLKKVIVKLC